MRNAIALLIALGLLGMCATQAVGAKVSEPPEIVVARGEPTGPHDLTLSTLLMTMTPNGTEVRQLTSVKGFLALDGSADDAVWSPNGSMIAYATGTSMPLTGSVFPTPGSIWVTDANGTHKRQLTPTIDTATHQAQDMSPSWSPNGRSIVFSRVTQTSNFATRLCIIATAGGRIRCLPVSLVVSASDPEWGNDGIVYVGDGGIWEVNPDGTDAHRIVTMEAPTGANVQFGGFALSRTGQIAYFTSSIDSPIRPGAVNYSHTVITIVGTHTRHIDVPLDVTSLTWSPDDQSFALTAHPEIPIRTSLIWEAENKIYTVKTDDQDLKRISDLNVIPGISWR